MLMVLELGKYHILFIQTVTDSVFAVFLYMELLSDSGVILKVKEICNLKALCSCYSYDLGQLNQY